MPYAIVNHRVEDFDKWKTAFESNISARRAAGQKSYRIFRNIDDFNRIVLLIEWENFDNARKFVKSDKLREVMRTAGVLGKTEILFLEELEAGSI